MRGVTVKLKDEGPIKSTQARLIGIITSTIATSLQLFLDYHAPVDGAIHNLNLLCMWEKFMLSPIIIIIIISFGLSHYGLVSYTDSKSKHRDVYMYSGCDYLVCVCTF